jgi:hypothetical protein
MSSRQSLRDVDHTVHKVASRHVAPEHIPLVVEHYKKIVRKDTSLDSDDPLNIDEHADKHMRAYVKKNPKHARVLPPDDPKSKHGFTW